MGLLFIIVTAPLIAQYLPNISEMNETEKMLVFENNKKSPALAVFYSALISSSGHAYAGDWNRGLLFTGAEVLGILFSLHNLNQAYKTENMSCSDPDLDYVNPYGSGYGCYWNTTDDPWTDYTDEITYGARHDGGNPSSKYLKLKQIGLFSVLGMIVWEKIDVVKQVKKYNNNLYRKIFDKEPPSFSLILQPTYQGANLTISYAIE